MEMNIKDLVTVVADKAKISHQQAESALCATFDTITEFLNNKEEISIPNFGSFSAKTLTKITTGMPSIINSAKPVKTVMPCFKASLPLKEFVNGQSEVKQKRQNRQSRQNRQNR